MAVYDLEEQEQLDDLKAWWKRWGNLVSGIVIAVCVGIVGVQGWRWWKHNQAEQASVLYGAATFSEDVDVWIRPSVANARRLLLALAAGRGRVYKLTPPMTLRNQRFGHGFHFTLPRGSDTLYLDVMAVPPRVGSCIA